MIVNRYSPQDLQAVHGIEMSEIEGTGAGAGWGRVAPGCSLARQLPPGNQDSRGAGSVTLGSRCTSHAVTIHGFP